jgi:tetratricopeptide (TPR) repeat protein
VIARLCIILLACISFVLPSQCGKADIEEVPANVQLAAEHIEQGHSYFDLRLFDKALTEYNAAMELDPMLPEVYWSIGRVYYFDQGKYSRAEDAYSRAIELDGEYIDAYFYRGLAREANGAYSRAIEDFSKVIDLAPGMVMAYHLRAWCNAQLAQWNRSSQLLLYQLFEKDPGLANAFHGAGWAYVRQTQWDLFAIPYLVRDTDAGNGQQITIPDNSEPRRGKFPTVPYVQIEPVYGPVGTKLYIYGWGFRTGEDGLTITWDREIIMCNIVAEKDGSMIVDGSKREDGTTRETLYVPESTKGDHIIGVYGSSFTPIGVVNDTVFEVVPEIKLSPEPDIKGTKVSIAGTGFTGGETVTVNVGEGITEVTATADDNGSFHTSVIVPTIKGNTYAISVSGDRGDSAQADFVISLERPVPTGQEPGVAELYCNRGFSHFKKAQWALAIENMESAYAEDPKLNRSQWNRDWALEKQAQWDTVIDDCEKAIALLTDTAVQPDASGPVILEEEYKLALEDYNKAADLSGDTTFSRRMMDAIQFIEEWGAGIKKVD